MAIRITCPACDEEFNVADSLRGKKTSCAECGKTISVPGKSSRGDPDDDDEDERITAKKSRAPVKAKRHRDDEDDDDEDDDDEDDDDDAPRRKKKNQGSSAGILIACGGGALLVVGVVVFLLMRSGDGNKPAPNPPVAQNNGEPVRNPIADPPPVVDPPPMVDPMPVAVVPVTLPKKDEPKVDVAGNEEPVPVPVPGGAMSGEKIYQRLLKSTVWIIAAQKEGINLEIPDIKGPGEGKPDENKQGFQPFQFQPKPKQPKKPFVPKGQNPLVGTSWSGNETLPGFDALTFNFNSPNAVTKIDVKGNTQGNYNLHANGQQITLHFPGNVRYDGQINGQTMGGKAHNGKENWDWTVTHGAPAQQPPPQQAQPGEKPSPKLPPGMRFDISFGTGSVVDIKHRLVLTNVHVVGKPFDMRVFFPEFDSKGELIAIVDSYKDKKSYKGKVVMEAPQKDLALVQLESLPPGIKALPIAKAKPLPAQQVHSLGNPIGASRALWIYSPGKVRQVYQSQWKIRDDDGKFSEYDAMRLETDSPLNPGDSGGPLVNDRGSLVGIAHAGNIMAQSFSIFIEGSEARALLEKYYKSIGDTYVPVPEVGGSGEINVAQLTDWIKKLSHKDFAVRIQAAKTIGGLGSEASLAFGKMFACLKDNEALVKRVVAEEIERIPPHKDDMKMLVTVLKEEAEPLEVRVQAAKALARLGQNGRVALPDLFETLKAPEEDLRKAALFALAFIGPEAKDVPELAKILKAGTPENRRLVMDVFGRMGADAAKAVPDIAALAKAGDRAMRQHALKTLEAMGETAKPATPTLDGLLKDSDRDISLPAARILAKLGDTKLSVPAIGAMLKGGTIEQRKEAARTLGELGKSAKLAVKELAASLDDDVLRDTSAQALIRIGGSASYNVSIRLKAWVKMPGNNPKTRLAAIEVLSHIGQGSRDAIEALTVAVSADPSGEVRQAALIAGKKLASGS